MLRENSVNENCYKCHAEKRGPFLWEHNPVRENCLNCHDAHGSTKQALLKVQAPKLCGECHGFNHGGSNPLDRRPAASSSTRDAAIAIRRFMVRTIHRECSSSGERVRKCPLGEAKGLDGRAGVAAMKGRGTLLLTCVAGAMIAGPLQHDARAQQRTAAQEPWWMHGEVEIGGRFFLNNPSKTGANYLGQKSLRNITSTVRSSRARFQTCGCRWEAGTASTRLISAART